MLILMVSDVLHQSCNTSEQDFYATFLGGLLDRCLFYTRMVNSRNEPIHFRITGSFRFFPTASACYSSNGGMMLPYQFMVFQMVLIFLHPNHAAEVPHFWEEW
jgi:hypothetical protein